MFRREDKQVCDLTCPLALPRPRGFTAGDAKKTVKRWHSAYGADWAREGCCWRGDPPPGYQTQWLRGAALRNKRKSLDLTGARRRDAAASAEARDAAAGVAEPPPPSPAAREAEGSARGGAGRPAALGLPRKDSFDSEGNRNHKTSPHSVVVRV